MVSHQRARYGPLALREYLRKALWKGFAVLNCLKRVKVWLALRGLFTHDGLYPAGRTDPMTIGALMDFHARFEQSISKPLYQSPASLWDRCSAAMESGLLTAMSLMYLANN